MAINSAINEEPIDSFTSMIDIVFLLLIFFILQPFKAPEFKMPADLPRMERPPENQLNVTEPKVEIKVRVVSVPSDPSNAVFLVDGRKIGTANQKAGKKIAGYLVSVSHGDKEAPVTILPSEDVHFGHVLAVLDACYAARMPNVKFGFGN